MARLYNFSAGPSGLPEPVMKQAQSEFFEYGNLGSSIVEISHRTAPFINIYNQAQDRLRNLLQIPEEFAILFLVGGATLQSAAIAMNFLGGTKDNNETTAAYAITGHWSKRTEQEAQKYCNTHIAATTQSNGYTQIPNHFDTHANHTYLHYADNETIHGVEFPAPPNTKTPLVADMSSNILSRPIDFKRFAAVYAGTQKNIAPAGVTVVIVRQSLINPMSITPSVINYKEQIDKQSMLNTPPTFQIYMMGLVLEWIEQQGGIDEMENRAIQRSTLLYNYLDNSDFYHTPVTSPNARSRMNIPFFLPNEHTANFLAMAEKKGLMGLKGHRAIGGIRASLYNAMPIDGVHRLIDHCQAFAKQYS